MDAKAKADLEQAVQAGAQAWPAISGGDPNTIDLWLQARRVESVLHLQLPTAFPPKPDGVAIVEMVEKHFVAGSLIRFVPPATLAARAVKLVEAIEAANICSFPPASVYVTALYTWHGCILMAKSLRLTFNAPGQPPYTDEMRWNEYANVKNYWTQEEVRGNGWVRYGVTLARLLEQMRKKEDFAMTVIEQWVPRESPYWEP